MMPAEPVLCTGNTATLYRKEKASGSSEYVLPAPAGRCNEGVIWASAPKADAKASQQNSCFIRVGLMDGKVRLRSTISVISTPYIPILWYFCGMKILDGKLVSAAMREKLAKEVAQLSAD